MTEKNNEDPLTENSLQVKLAAYHKALKEEYELTEKAIGDKKEEIVEGFFNKHIPTAAAKIIHLMQFSSSDSTQLAAAKYILDRKPGAGTTDPIASLIEQLKKNPTSDKIKSS